MREVRQWLPEELEDLAPGPELATLLASVDRDALSDKDRVRLARARNRLSAHVQAELMTDLYAVTQAEPPEDEDADTGWQDPDSCPYPWAQTELSFALRWTYLAVSVRLGQARRLLDELPQVHTALATGRIDMPKALLFLEMLEPLELPAARRIADRLLEQACELTTGQLRARLRRLVIAADPQRAANHAKVGIKRRRVATMLNDDGLAEISGYDMAPHRIAASWERLNAIAKAAKAAGDPRRMDELRADAFLDLLIGEGVAAGGPISNGGIEDLPHSSNGPTVDGGHAGDPDRQPSDKDSPAADADDPAGADAAGSTDIADPADSAGAGKGMSIVNRQMPPAAVAPDAGTPWPREPADPSLLDPKADPPIVHPSQANPGQAAGRRDQPEQEDPAGDPPPRPPVWDGPPPEPPPEDQTGDQTVDPDHEQLRPYWLAGFDQLATRRPGTCPQCGHPPATGPMPGPRRGTLDIQVALSTLMHLDELPAELAGFGPLLADIARQVAEQCPDLQWRFSVHNELDTLIAHGITKARPTPTPTTGKDGRRTNRRPTADVAAFVRARNRTCIAVGCRRPSTRCELDHTLAWGEHGESEPDNLGPGCKRHHHFKDSHGCQLVHFGGGVFGWQTPLGLQYTTRPDPPLYEDAEIVEPCEPADQ